MGAANPNAMPILGKSCLGQLVGAGTRACVRVRVASAEDEELRRREAQLRGFLAARMEDIRKAEMEHGKAQKAAQEAAANAKKVAEQLRSVQEQMHESKAPKRQQRRCAKHQGGTQSAAQCPGAGGWRVGVCGGEIVVASMVTASSDGGGMLEQDEECALGRTRDAQCVMCDVAA
eukprot:1161904-Pelagomonas_calceolata.AAC.8